MPRQIDDNEYQRLTSKGAVADFIQSIWDDPATGKDARRLVKRKYPNLQIPDLDIEDGVRRELDARDKKKADEDKAVKEKTDKERWASEKAAAQKKYGITDETMTEVEKFMVEKGVADYETAVGYHVARNPKPSDPTAPFNDGHWNHGRSEEFKTIAADPEGFARREIMKAIEADTQRARGGVL